MSIEAASLAVGEIAMNPQSLRYLALVIAVYPKGTVAKGLAAVDASMAEHGYCNGLIGLRFRKLYRWLNLLAVLS